MGYFGSVGLMLAQVLFGLAMIVPVLRILLPLSRTRFSNSICQAVYRATNPVVGPLSRVLPTWRGLSTAAVLVAWIASTVFTTLLLWAFFGLPDPLLLPLLGLGTLVQYVLTLYFWIIVVVALMSFFSPDYGNPVVEVLLSLARPVLAPFERIPIRFGDIGLSPLWAGLSIQIAKFTLSYFGVPSLF